MGIPSASTTGILATFFEHIKRLNFKINDFLLKGLWCGGGFICSVKPFLTRHNLLWATTVSCKCIYNCT